MDYIVFKKLGLNDKEIMIYLTLVETGACSVRRLAEVTKINRGTAYDVLKKLQEQGLISYYHQKTNQQFVAEDPEKLIRISEEKQADLNKTKDNLLKIIPELNSLRKKNHNKPVSKLYEGNRGIRFILEDVLENLIKKQNREYYIYSAKNSSEDLNKAYPNFTKDRIKKKIMVKAISLAKGGGLSGLDERKWLGTQDETATFIIIYAGKCAFISRDDSDNPVGVIIENNMIYETQKNIFLKLWELLK